MQIEKTIAFSSAKKKGKILSEKRKIKQKCLKSFNTTKLRHAKK
jgi:hypothetical protein